MPTFSSPARRTTRPVARLFPRLERLEERTVPTAVFPADSGFSSLWGLHNTGQTGGRADADIDAPEAWGVTTGSTAVTVAVIDTGIDYTHPDLYLNVWINQDEIPPEMRPALLNGSPDPGRLRDADGDGRITFYDLNAPDGLNAAFVTDLNGNGYIDAGDLLGRVSARTNVRTMWENGLDDDGVGGVDDLVGWNYVANTNDPYDDNGHGTHVAGTIGATPNAYGVVGVSWTTQIMALKILGPAGSDTLGEVVKDAAAAIRDAVGNGARVSNNSWVFYDTGTNRVAGETVQGTKYADLYAAIKAAGAAGHLVVAAGGNDGYDNDTSAWRNYPASYDLANIISVAASDKNDQRASFSNYGAKTVDLAAPGGAGGVVPRANDNIWSTVPVALDTDGTADGYTAARGTSMAAPHVTGTIALMLSVRPDLTAARVKELLLASVDPLTDASWLTSKKVGGKTVTEHRLASGGRLNAGRAVQAAAAQPPAAGTLGASGPAAPAAPTGSNSAGAGGAASISAAGVPNDRIPMTATPAAPNLGRPSSERVSLAASDSASARTAAARLGRVASASRQTPDGPTVTSDWVYAPPESDGGKPRALEEWLFAVYVG